MVESAELCVFARGYSNTFINAIKRHVRLIFRVTDHLEVRSSVGAHLDLHFSRLPHGAAPSVETGIEHISLIR